MAKRLTDSNKWDDPFFIDLSAQYKLLWIYILDKCDHAGIFKWSNRLVKFNLDTEYDVVKVFEIFGKRIVKITNEKWFIPKFIEFQYSELKENNKVHQSVISILKREGIYKEYSSSLQGAKEQDKDKEKDPDKEKENIGIPITPEEKNRVFGLRQIKFINQEREKKGLKVFPDVSPKDKDDLQSLASVCGREEKIFQAEYITYLDYPFNTKSSFESDILNKGHPIYGFLHFFGKMDGKQKKSKLDKLREQAYAEDSTD